MIKGLKKKKRVLGKYSKSEKGIRLNYVYNCHQPPLIYKKKMVIPYGQYNINSGSIVISWAAPASFWAWSWNAGQKV